MTSYSALLSGLERGPHGRIHTIVPESWMQGRTTYGGLTAALAHEAAAGLAEGRPLRAVQIAFVGPCGGDVIISPSVLRAGRTSLFVSVDLVTEAGVAARGLFTFGHARASAFRFATLGAPDLAGPETCDIFFPAGAGPKFTEHFDMRLASGDRPMAGGETADIHVWVKHRDPQAPPGATTLLTLGDALPPAIMSRSDTPAAISSMTWMAEVLPGTAPSPDGWWLANARAEAAGDGYVSQAMTLWNRAGVPAMIGRQTIAIFA